MLHRGLTFALGLVSAAALIACDAGGDPGQATSSAGPGAGVGGGGDGGGPPACQTCEGNVYVDCDGGRRDCDAEELFCSPQLGCSACAPGVRRCDGAAGVEVCKDDGSGWETAASCDLDAGESCSEGYCQSACDVAEDQPSNVGCEFWAVDLDQQDGGGNDPASEPWGLTLANVGDGEANVTIHINNAEPGQPQDLEAVLSTTIAAGTLKQVTLQTRELDCGVTPNDYGSPGTCLSSRAFRVTSSSPIVVTQFNVFENSYSNDASLLLPTNALGNTYRVIGWNAGHPAEVPLFEGMVDRSYITVVGTADGTEVRVKPSWKIKGNPPIAATPAGGEITVTLNEFDVLNLETDTATLQDDPQTVADLSGSAVYSDKPVAVFSGVESTAAPGWVEIPTPPGWEDEEGGGNSCCLDHLEEQLFPVESVGAKYMVTRSPVRSTGSYREPDVIRFVGAAETANVTTTLPSPFNSFTLQPGEVRTTWTQDNFTATGDKPFLLGQLLVSQGYVDGGYLGDPALTVYPPVDQYRSEYIILTPGSWDQNWVVISAPVGSSVTIDGAAPSGCRVEPGGTIDGVTYESRVCALTEGTHSLSGDAPFGIVAYGYAGAGSYAFVGGADVKKIYEPPPPPN
jgi:hypothetical protein